MLTESQISALADLAAKHAREKAILAGRHQNEREQLVMTQAAEFHALQAELQPEAK